MTNYYNAENGVYIFADTTGNIRTSRYLADRWQGNAGYSDPGLAFEERWHWAPSQKPEEEQDLPSQPAKPDAFSYLGVYEVVSPAGQSTFINCTCPTFTPILLPGNEYACEQLCDGKGQYASLGECLQNHPNGPGGGGGGGNPPGYDQSVAVISMTGGLPNGITYPDPEYGPCSQNAQGFYTAWTYSQPQAPEKTSGVANDLSLALVGSTTLYTEDGGGPRIGSLPIGNTGVDRWTPYGSPIFIDFTAAGQDAYLRQLVNTEAIKSRLSYSLYEGGPDGETGVFIKKCVVDSSTEPVRIYGLGIHGVAEWPWANCGGNARYMFTLPNRYPGCHQSVNAQGEDVIWCGWAEYSNSQNGNTSGPPTLPSSVAGVSQFWSAADCPDGGGGGVYQPPIGPPGQYDRDYSIKELFVFGKGIGKPISIGRMNAQEPVRVLVSPQERQFVLTYGQKPEPFRQGPNNFCKAIHISKTAAQSGLPVTKEASVLLDADYVSENIGKLNAFAKAALTNAPQLPEPLLIKVNGNEPWVFSTDYAGFDPGYVVFMQNKILSTADKLLLPDLLFNQADAFGIPFSGTEAFNTVSRSYVSKQKAQPIQDTDAGLIAFGLNISAKIKFIQ